MNELAVETDCKLSVGQMSLCLVVDAVHDPVQPTGQAAPAEVVRRLCRQSQEENRA